MKTSLTRLAFAWITIFLGSEIFFSQDLRVKITVIPQNRINVEGKFSNSTDSNTNISFLQSYADAVNLAERIENFKAFDDSGKSIEVKKLIAGEYLASKTPISWTYQVNLKPSAKITDSAHASWMSENGGLLMLADLLPLVNFQQKGAKVGLEFDLPKDFRIANQYAQNQKQYDVYDIENAVFYVGRDWREKRLLLSSKDAVNVAIAGSWQFSDDEAIEMIRLITEEYKQMFRQVPVPFSQIILLPFPQENSNNDRWRAETRGSTVTIISGSLPFKSLAVQRLHEQLRHEIFHLWMPNGINLSGNYDWFFEGFTIYHALRTGVELNQIRFEDYLNTLGRAYDLTQIFNETQTLSLIEASKKRWQNDNNFLYAKGMIVAFLCDLSLQRETKGKQNLKKVLGKIYEKHKKSPGGNIQDGNTAILNILKNYPEIALIINNYIIGTKIIDWNRDLETLGIISEKEGFRVKLRVLDKPNGRQKDLLDKLGYNRWRKILQKKK